MKRVAKRVVNAFGIVTPRGRLLVYTVETKEFLAWLRTSLKGNCVSVTITYSAPTNARRK